MNKLESTNHKVNSDWRETKDFTWYVLWKKTKIKCKVNPEWDIFEYISWVPSNLIGEQLFTFYAVKRLGLEKRLPTFEDFSNGNHKQFIKDSNILFSGSRDPFDEGFHSIGIREELRLSDGDNIEVYEDNILHTDNDHSCGFSLRFLKELDKSDTSTIWLFESIVERAESYWAKLWASAWYKLGKILDWKNK